MVGEYLFPCCNDCNLKLKFKKRTRKQTRHDRDDVMDDPLDEIEKLPEYNEHDAEEEYMDEFFLPVVFHNLRNYDAHFIIKNYRRRYQQLVSEDGEVSYKDIKVTPINSEKFILFEIGMIRFIASFQFLSSSLEN